MPIQFFQNQVKESQSYASDLSREEIDQMMARVYKRGDRLMKFFIGLHYAFSIAFAFVYDTWLVTLIAGTSAFGMFIISAKLLPGSFITRCIAGISLQIFVILHIYQLHGLTELHFFFFVSYTVLIVYQDWKSLWPGTALIVTQHLAFAILHNLGVNLYFYQESYISVLKLIFHFGIVILHLFVCVYWTHLLRRQTIKEAIQQKELAESKELAEKHLHLSEKAREEVEEANQTLHEMNKDLHQLNEEKNMLMGIVAHDLQNPLAGILIATETLQAYHPQMSSQQLTANLERLLNTGNRMKNSINQLLESNAVESGSLELTLAPLDLSALTIEILEQYFSRAKTKNITLDFDFDIQPITITSDHKRLTSILDNLISNAVKYSPFDKTIYIEIAPGDKTVVWSIRDEGPGISADDQKKLFGKYQRLTARPTAGEHSTGLGLSIVKKLADEMNFKVRCESREGEGATFYLEIPLICDIHPKETSVMASHIPFTKYKPQISEF